MAKKRKSRVKKGQTIAARRQADRRRRERNRPEATKTTRPKEVPVSDQGGS